MARKKIKTKNPESSNDSRNAVKANDVSTFLQANPDFFVSQPELLTSLTLPSTLENETTSVVDFQIYQLEKRTAEIDELRSCADNIIETSRYNMDAQTRTHAAALALIQVTDIDQLFQVVIDDLPTLLDVNKVLIGFEQTNQKNFLFEHPKIKKIKPGTIDQLIDGNLDAELYGELDKQTLKLDPKINQIESAVFARLRLGGCLPSGILMLGSRKKQFSANQGTELIVFLARVLQSCLLRFWQSK